MACLALQEQIKGLQAEVQLPLSMQQAEVQAAAAARKETSQDKLQHEQEQVQQASLRLAPRKPKACLQVLRHRQGVCWQHKMGTCLLPDTLWPLLSGWLIGSFWAFFQDLCHSPPGLVDVPQRLQCLTFEKAQQHCWT